MRFFRFLHPFAIALLALPLTASALQTKSVRHETFSDFQGGELENISLSRNGLLRLAPTASEFASLVEPTIWDALFSPEGDLFVAAGNHGKIYQVSPKGDLSEFAATDETFIRALAIDSSGRLYLGSSPDGKVYRADADGNLEVFFEPRETYIWSMLFDENGDLFVATGDKGRIYRVAKDAEPGSSGEIYFETSENHISTITSDQNGNLLAGTAPNGHLYRIEDRKNAFLLFNSPDEEIREIEIDPSGDLFVATFSGKKADNSSGAIAEALAALSSISESSSSESNENSTSGDRNSSNNQQRPGTIYRIDPDGFHENYWGVNGVSIYSLLRSRDGDLLVGTGSDGRIFSVENPVSWKLQQSIPTGSEVSRLLRIPDSENIAALTSNPARIFKLNFDFPEKGEYRSEVFDARQIASWGQFYAENSNGKNDGIEISLRTGNSEKADSNWTEWKTLENEKTSANILQPARYLQYRLTLSDPETEVRRVRFFYRHPNAAPTITAIRVVLADLGFQQFEMPPQQSSIDLEQLFRNNKNEEQKSTPETRNQLRPYEKPGTVTIAWKANDPNKDELRYRVKIRPADSQNWEIIGDDLDRTFLSFDSNGMPEGFYEAKIIATDHRSNPPSEARIGERISEPFLIDNTAPEIELKNIEITDSKVSISLKVQDKWNIISEAEFTLDGQKEPTALFPTDRLFDSKEKEFKIELSDLAPGRHTVLFKVSDEQQNRSVETISFEIDSR